MAGPAGRLIAAGCAGALLIAAGPAAPDPVAALAGRYDGQHAVRPHDGTDTAETIVEIVPVAPDAAYVRVHYVSYGNGICGLHAVARREGRRLVYRQSSPAGGSACVLAVAREGNRLRLDDGGTCRDFCGVTASLSGVALPFARRRPITYMRRLKDSREFRDALGDWHRPRA